MIDRLADDGVHVERETELLDFQETSTQLLARLKRTDGSQSDEIGTIVPVKSMVEKHGIKLTDLQDFFSLGT